MVLAKWGSNSKEIGDLLNKEFLNKTVGEESFKVLGMRWLASEDFFAFDGIEIPNDICITKRMVLSLISRLFDPLGFLAPFIITELGSRPLQLQTKIQFNLGSKPFTVTRRSPSE